MARAHHETVSARVYAQPRKEKMPTKTPGRAGQRQRGERARRGPTGVQAGAVNEFVEITGAQAGGHGGLVVCCCVFGDNWNGGLESSEGKKSRTDGEKDKGTHHGRAQEQLPGRAGWRLRGKGAGHVPTGVQADQRRSRCCSPFPPATLQT